jgi:uncharacterized protein YcfJ
MYRTFVAALGLGTLMLAQHAAAQVTFYEQEGFRGQSFVTDKAIGNLERYGFNDRASSAIVDRGPWEVCEDANFGGRCTVLRSGQYPSLGAMGLSNRISSLRRVSSPPPTAIYAPPPVPPVPPPYPYYPKHGERLYTADVVAVRAVMGQPEQRCWVEQQQVAAPSGPNVPGAIIGGILGGVLGHQIGGGRGNDVATAVGAVGGAAVGANVNHGGGSYTQNVQRCETVPGTGQPSYWDVTYVFRGVTHRAQLAFAPGATITVNGRGEPRV